MDLSKSVEGLFDWMDDAADEVVPGKREVAKPRKFRPPSDESIECVLSWMDELASDCGHEEVVQAKRPTKKKTTRRQPVVASPTFHSDSEGKKARKPKKGTRRQPKIVRELGPPPSHAVVVTGRRIQPEQSNDEGLTASEVWLLGSSPEVALESDAGRSAQPRPPAASPIRAFTPPPAQPVTQPVTQPQPVAQPQPTPTQRYRKVLSAEERKKTIERANGLVDWMSDLMRRWEESSEGVVFDDTALPPVPPPLPPLPSREGGKLRADQLEDVFARAQQVARRSAKFENELCKLESPPPAFETELCELDNPTFETEVCENPVTESMLCALDTSLETDVFTVEELETQRSRSLQPRAPRVPQPKSQRQSRHFDPRDPFDPLARDPFAHAVFDPFSPPEERRAS